MEIGPILRAMLRNKLGVGLLVVEIAFAVAVVVICLGIVAKNRASMSIPTGLDERNILTIQIQSHGAAFDEASYMRQVIDRDLDTIRAQPGVLDASVMSPWPLQGGGSSTQMKPTGQPDSALVRCPVYRADTHFLATFGLELVEGRAFADSDIPLLPDPADDAPPAPDNVIVTKALADALYPDGALGKQLTGPGGGDTGDTIVGIVRYMYTPYDNGASGMEYRILFYPRKPGSPANLGYMVRAEPGAIDALFTGLEERLEALNRERVVKTVSLMEIKQRGLFLNLIVVRILSTIIGLLLFVTAIGMFGMTSFAVAKRTRQIGVRRALGARKFDIARLFLVENGLIAGAGTLLGLTLAITLNLLILSKSDAVPRVSAGPVLFALALIAVVVFLSTLVPALRAARVPPATASRAA
ncbi:MAG: FtsX-like permease family protein [Planctomycetes bacterium]|nr:FtsX-like permease family protein [Planctomycetota bacterium]